MPPCCIAMGERLMFVGEDACEDGVGTPCGEDVDMLRSEVDCPGASFGGITWPADRRACWR